MGTYDDEGTSVLALPEPIENALQALQFEKKKKIFEWKSMRALGANLRQTEIAQKEAVLHRTWLDADWTISRFRTNNDTITLWLNIEEKNPSLSHFGGALPNCPNEETIHAK